MEFAVLTLITGSSKTFLEMAITEDFSWKKVRKSHACWQIFYREVDWEERIVV